MSEYTTLETIQNNLAMIKEELAKTIPNIAQSIRFIHQALSKDQDLVTIMSEEELAVLISGLKVQTRTEITASVAKSGAGAKAVLKNATLDDF